jgi:hypothetical protein
MIILTNFSFLYQKASNTYDIIDLFRKFFLSIPDFVMKKNSIAQLGQALIQTYKSILKEENEAKHKMFRTKKEIQK